MIKITRVIGYALLTLVPLKTAWAWDVAEQWAEVMRLQAQRGQALPAPSSYGMPLSLEEAYRVQYRLTRALAPPEGITGYKIAYSSVLNQVRAGLKHPVVGVLFTRAHLVPEAEIDLRQFTNLQVRLELGFIMSRRVRTPISSGRAALQAVKQVVPVVHFVAPMLEGPAPPRAADSVAANLGTDRLIIGQAHPSPNHDNINSLVAELAYGGEILDRGAGRNIMGDQLRALAWQINELLRRGYGIKRDQILLTGALGKNTPVRSGTYTARFKELENITFVVVAK